MEFDWKEEQGGIRPSLRDTVGVLLSAVTIAVAALCFFTDLTFSVGTAANFSVTLLILLFCSYSMYFSMADTGVRQGERDAGYLRARTRYEELRARVLSEDGNALERFCTACVERELAAARHFVLMRAGITEKEYEQTYRGMDRRARRALPRAKRRMLRRLERLRPIRLTPQLLLADTDGGEGRALIAPSPGVRRLRRSLLFVLPAALLAVFTASVACTVLLTPTAANVTAAVMRLFTLLWNGVRGYRMGYGSMTREGVRYYDSRSDLLGRFEAYAAQGGNP